jgi:hypothetical protein
MLSLHSGAEPVALRRGPVDAWYADCPLSPSNSTQIVLESRDAVLAASNEVVWTEWNLFAAPTNSLILRTGDSLLLNAYQPGATNGTAGIEIAGVTNYTAAVGSPVPHEFELPGEYTVSGTFGGVSTQMVVTAVASHFGADPVCLIGQPRQWSCPGLSTNAVVEADPGIGLLSEERAGGGYEFSLTARDNRSRYMIARLGEDGPITDRARVRGIRYETTAFYEVQIIDRFADGSELVEYTIHMDEVPEDLEIELHIFVGGVLFDDGTRNRTVTAADFDEYGYYRYRMVKAPGIRTGACHRTCYEPN